MKMSQRIMVKKPTMHPMAMDKNMRPDVSISKWYTLPNVKGTPAKKLKRTPKLTAM
jgi:hypothetical protein